MASEGEPVGRTRSGSVRRERLNSQEQAQGVVRRPKKTKRTKLQRQSTLIRTEVESLPTFWPVFIVAVTIAQVSAQSMEGLYCDVRCCDNACCFSV